MTNSCKTLRKYEWFAFQRPLALTPVWFGVQTTPAILPSMKLSASMGGLCGPRPRDMPRRTRILADAPLRRRAGSEADCPPMLGEHVQLNVTAELEAEGR